MIEDDQNERIEHLTLKEIIQGKEEKLNKA